ncbi:hypothetical protein LCGC14_2615320 [marine sediment metagenome]|uniref:Uncharacterized protein n=1 Tax=marine sediment metagenome TaxID=412755 RepID=A0A0F9ASB7_9ZZZZ
MTEGAATTKELNLQARFEQLESGINEAHSIVDQVTPREVAEGAVAKAPESSSASATAVRCQESLASLINRLQNLRDRVGQV